MKKLAILFTLFSITSYAQIDLSVVRLDNKLHFGDNLKYGSDDNIKSLICTQEYSTDLINGKVVKGEFSPKNWMLFSKVENGKFFTSDFINKYIIYTNDNFDSYSKIKCVSDYKIMLLSFFNDSCGYMIGYIRIDGVKTFGIFYTENRGKTMELVTKIEKNIPTSNALKMEAISKNSVCIMISFGTELDLLIFTNDGFKTTKEIPRKCKSEVLAKDKNNFYTISLYGNCNADIFKYSKNGELLEEKFVRKQYEFNGQKYYCDKTTYAPFMLHFFDL